VATVTPELWALSVLAAAGVFLIGYALIPDKPVRAVRSDHLPEHSIWAMNSPTQHLGAAARGKVEEWPWGQPASRFMYDYRGHLIGPLADPLEWMQSQLDLIDQRR
jgi:hypothetical protein